jgi:hypothetical protein
VKLTQSAQVERPYSRSSACSSSRANSRHSGNYY